MAVLATYVLLTVDTHTPTTPTLSSDGMTRIAAECQNGRNAEWQNGGMAEWRNGGMAEWRNGGMANGMAEWRNGRRNDGMTVTHGLNLRILTAEHGSFP
jgi:rSAM-associated Gly-rich repeat protein